MKVLLVTISFPPAKGGVEDGTFLLANALAAQSGVQVAVLTGIGADACEGLEIFAVMKQWRIGEIFTAIKAIHASRADIVHIQYATQGPDEGRLPWILPAVAFLMGKKVVQTWHEGYNSRRHAPELLLRSIVPGALITLHETYRERLHPMLRWALWKRRHLIIPPGSHFPRAHINAQVREEVRQKYLKKGQSRLCVFFAFVLPKNGAEFLFDICDPRSDHIVIAGEFGKPQAYHLKVTSRTSSPPWSGRSTITGFLPKEEVPALLAVADAVILPFRRGRGEANRSSVYSAVMQGTFVLTTSCDVNGYDEKRNVYYARPDDIEEMQLALKTYAGMRREPSAHDIDAWGWGNVASQHLSLYKQLL